MLTTSPLLGTRLLRVLAAALLATCLASAPASGDDDDAPGTGADAGGDGGTGGGFPGLGPNPGRIQVPGVVQRLFAPAPARPGPELVVAGLSADAVARLRGAGFAVLAERGGLARVRGPSGQSAAAALARLRALAPTALADRNHRYRLAAEDAPAPDAAAPPAAAIGCGVPAGLLIALVDTGVDPRHPSLAGMIERQEAFRSPGRRAARVSHGTAVAVRLATAVPGARIAVLDAFHLDSAGDAADAFDVAAAVSRTAEIGAQIANLSFVGPRNAVLDRVGSEAAAAGVTFVAAAGNDGPRARPLYPAAHDWTLAVAAVDARGLPWPRSAAGGHIAFSALGVGVPVPPASGGRPRLWSGTSVAAPMVAAALARLPERGALQLAAVARDAGPPGRDPVFGWGVIEPPPCPAGPDGAEE